VRGGCMLPLGVNYCILDIGVPQVVGRGEVGEGECSERSLSLFKRRDGLKPILS